jgi:hypothetical protein
MRDRFEQEHQSHFEKSTNSARFFSPLFRGCDQSVIG